MMEYGCIAQKLAHSFSKDIHSRFGSYGYELCELTPTELDTFFAKRDFKGINVTIPYKTDVIKYLDEISDEARKINAVNTVVNMNGKLCGYNTDYFGLQALLDRSGIMLKGKKVAVLGSGGTAKTAFAVAADCGASEILTVSRSQKPNCITYDELYANHTDIQVLINTTPCGMFPDIDAVPIDLTHFANLNAVVDAVYNPLRTRLVCEAGDRGIKAVGGLYMLVSQAAYAAEKFFGDSSYINMTERVYNDVFKARMNAVLIGMPGSGKTTVGKILAENTGYSFADTDLLAEMFDGRTPKEIITSSGEKYFRLLERSVAAALAIDNGKVIATGGGIVLDKRNIDLLRQNGRIYLINTPVEAIIPTDDRPLSSTREMLEKVWSERKELYFDFADVVIDDTGDPMKTAMLIKEDILENSCD